MGWTTKVSAFELASTSTALPQAASVLGVGWLSLEPSMRPTPSCGAVGSRAGRAVRIRSRQSVLLWLQHLKRGTSEAARLGLLICTVLIGAVAFSSQAAGSPRLAGETCRLDSLGLSLSHANYSADAILGEALGETFYTPDTLLESVTVWRATATDY